MSIAIIGASGNVGQKVANGLLNKNKDICVIGRASEKLSPLVDQGAVAKIGNLEDQQFLTNALQGVDTLFSMIPLNPIAEDLLEWQKQVGENIATAIENSNVSRVVNLSSIGADLEGNTGPILGLHYMEKRLNSVKNIELTHLRPTYFMENILMNADMIKTQNINGGALIGDTKLPMIATQDIANYAVDLITNEITAAQPVVDLLGHRDLDMKEITAVISKNIDKELPYIDFSYADTAGVLESMGMSKSVASAFVEMITSWNEETIQSTVTRTEENTTSTSIEEFISGFAVAFK